MTRSDRLALFVGSHIYIPEEPDQPRKHKKIFQQDAEKKCLDLNRKIDNISKKMEKIRDNKETKM